MQIQPEFFEKLKDNFIITESKENVQIKPSSKHTFGMFIEDKWYLLEAKKGSFNEEDPIKSLDVAILQDNILTPILERRVHKDMKVAFSMYPTEVVDIMKVADTNQVMPPKSTWFEPKLRSGLFVHKLR